MPPAVCKEHLYGVLHGTAFWIKCSAISWTIVLHLIAGMNLLGPSPSQYNILRVVFEAIESSRLQATQPLFLEQCMELVHQLAAAQDTGAAVQLTWKTAPGAQVVQHNNGFPAGPSMLELLRMRWFTGLEFVLDGIAMGTLQQDAQPCIATLNQMAWLLKVSIILMYLNANVCNMYKQLWGTILQCSTLSRCSW